VQTGTENEGFVVRKNSRKERSVSWHYYVRQGQESRTHLRFSADYLVSELFIGVFYVDLAVGAKGTRSNVL